MCIASDQRIKPGCVIIASCGRSRLYLKVLCAYHVDHRYLNWQRKEQEKEAEIMKDVSQTVGLAFGQHVSTLHGESR